VPRRGGELVERSLKGLVRALARVGPPGTVVLVPLVIGGAEQRAVPLAGQGLPVQVIGGGGAALARALAAAVLMHDDPAQPLRARRHPQRVRDAQLQLAGIGRGLIAQAVIGRSRRWKRRLRRGDDASAEEQENGS